jgi:hypothetical protein
MTLNKDLFGKIPVTAAKEEPEPAWQRHTMPEGTQVFHGSNVAEPQEFLKAPILHVGSAEQAAHIVNPDWRLKEDDEGFNIYDYAEDVDNVHPLAISTHAKVHPITVPDDIANEAQFHFLKERGHVPSSTVEFSKSNHGVKHPLVRSALNALRQNKIVPYKNEWETPDDLYEGADLDAPGMERDLREASKSFMVPSPHLNLLQFGETEKGTQPMLPMDYTGMMPPSKRTQRHRDIKREYPWASDGGIQAGRYD